jgi:transcriptional regulator with XRE-family HTH domain
MTGIREVLAGNIKEYRRKFGFSQDKLAELAGISSQYLATVETCRKFPTPEVLDRLAEALEINTYELFTVAPTPQNELEKLRQNIIGEVVMAIKQSFAEESKKQGEFKSSRSNKRTSAGKPGIRKIAARP